MLEEPKYNTLTSGLPFAAAAIANGWKPGDKLRSSTNVMLGEIEIVAISEQGVCVEGQVFSGVIKWPAVTSDWRRVLPDPPKPEPVHDLGRRLAHVQSLLCGGYIADYYCTAGVDGEWVCVISDFATGRVASVFTRKGSRPDIVEDVSGRLRVLAASA